MLQERISRLISRRRRAKELGFRFHRARDFDVPGHIRIFGRDVALSVPPQNTMQGCFLEVLMDDCYGLKHSGLGNIGTVLDIGGNVGFFALSAREAFPDATIHVYEPNPSVRPYLNTQAATCNAQVFGEAVGGEAGRVRLNEADFVNVRSVQDDGGEIEQVSFRTALERIGGHCDLAKIDCEGAEWGMLADIDAWRAVDHLRLEYHLWNTDRRHEDMPAVLQRIGFKILKQIPMGDFGVVWAFRSA